MLLNILLITRPDLLSQKNCTIRFRHSQEKIKKINSGADEMTKFTSVWDAIEDVPIKK